jgi:hypothetical protein
VVVLGQLTSSKWGAVCTPPGASSQSDYDQFTGFFALLRVKFARVNAICDASRSVASSFGYTNIGRVTLWRFEAMSQV